MKQYRYTFYFSDDTVSTHYATSRYQATIVAMAEKINKGEDFTIEWVTDDRGNKYHIVNHMDIDEV